MKWYKHMSDMTRDVKVKRVIRKYGAQGYALYNYVLELICRRLDADNPLPDLEESAADLAGDLGMDTLMVEEIIRYCIEQELFSLDEVTGRVVAHKIYKFLETSQTRNVELKRMIQRYHGDLSQTVSDNLGLSLPEETRREENRREEKKEGAQKVRHPATSLPMNQTRYDNLCRKYGKQTAEDYMEGVADWARGKGRRVLDVASTAANWIKRDGVQPVPGYAVKSVPTAPVKCPHCGGMVKSTHDEAMCVDCFVTWTLAGGRWNEG